MSLYEQLEAIFGKDNTRDITRNELEILASLSSPVGNPEWLRVCLYPGEGYPRPVLLLSTDQLLHTAPHQYLHGSSELEAADRDNS
jgi:hypothetical protein